MSSCSLGSIVRTPSYVCPICKVWKREHEYPDNGRGRPYLNRCRDCSDKGKAQARESLSETDPNAEGPKTRFRAYRAPSEAPRPRKRRRKNAQPPAFSIYKDHIPAAESSRQAARCAYRDRVELAFQPPSLFGAPSIGGCSAQPPVHDKKVSSIPRDFCFVTASALTTPPSSQEAPTIRCTLLGRQPERTAQQAGPVWPRLGRRPHHPPLSPTGFVPIETLETLPASREPTEQEPNRSEVGLPAGFTPAAFSVPRHDMGRMSIRCPHCSAYFWDCESRSSTAKEPAFGTRCCSNGQVYRDRTYHNGRLPPELSDMMKGRNILGRDLKKKIREYNSALSFASGQFIDPNRNLGPGGPIPFGVHGALYHRIRAYDPTDSAASKYAQLYFHDIEAATRTRETLFGGLNPQILRILATELKQLNQVAQVYQLAKERIEEQPNDGQAYRVGVERGLTPSFRRGVACEMRVVVRPGDDYRVANVPVSDEIAGLIPEDSADAGCRMVVLAFRDAEGRPDPLIRRVPCTSELYMPAMYPLLYPYGDPSWTTGMLRRWNHNSRETISLLEYFRWEANIRFIPDFIGNPDSPADWPSPHGFGRLFQQWSVDAWATVDQNKLDFYRFNQAAIRTDNFEAVQAAVAEGHTNGADIGKRVHMPASHIGSVKFMRECYRNSMAIVTALGKPTLFITFTANARWPEITRELIPGQQPIDRPDLVVRVFHEKARELRRLLQGGVLGRWAGHVWTIEYQKRGLPHMHLLLFLAPEDRERLTRPEFIDRVISAELPDPADDPDGILRDVIHSAMIHGPCGPYDPKQSCMKDREGNKSRFCRKNYPKTFCEETYIQEDGYPVYRRRNNSRTIQKRVGRETVEIDNTWVVPYSPYLCRKFGAHINVEVAVTVKCIKYIHKYIYKGTDRATLEIRSKFDGDECEEYIACRYIGPTEALWRLFEFKVHEEKPAVMTLDVHLPGQQRISWKDQQDLGDVLGRQRRARTTLLAFFEYNTDHSSGRHLTYAEFPRHFVLDPKNRVWLPRQRGVQLGRMWWFSPTDGEKFYLRLLLTRVQGPRSFEHLRTIDGVVHPTFKAACVALGLCTGDDQWRACFREARVWVSGHSLRLLFVTALLNGIMQDPPALWNEFGPDFCDNLLHQLQQDGVQYPPQLEHPELDFGLFLIYQELHKHNRTLADFELPEPEWGGWTANQRGNPLTAIERDYRPDEELAQLEELQRGFNEGQRRANDTIIEKISTDPGHAHFFLQGPAGTGKTYLYRALCHRYRAEGKIVLCVASSGIAALLLPGGTTAHSRFKIPIDITEGGGCNVSKISALAGLFNETDLIIWDEVPMQSRWCFEAVDRTLRDIRDEPNLLFGGIPVLFGGDFAQILPVVKNGTPQMIVDRSFRRSSIWPQLHVLALTQNMRVLSGEDNTRFAEWIRSLPYNEQLRGRINLFPAIRCFHSCDRFFHDIYPDRLLLGSVSDPTPLKSRAVLTVRNDLVNEINDLILARIPGESREYLSADEIVADSESEGLPTDSEINDPQFLQTLNTPSLPQSKLTLKVGAPIMLLRNLYASEGLCNGTRLHVKGLATNAIYATIIGGQFDNEKRVIPRVSLTSSPEDMGFVLRRTQFPVRLCYAMTINKSQGQSFGTVAVDLRSDVFSHGQFYVAMSRVTDVSRLTVLLPERSAERPDPTKVRNTVFPEVLIYVNNDGTIRTRPENDRGVEEEGIGQRWEDIPIAGRVLGRR